MEQSNEKIRAIYCRVAYKSDTAIQLQKQTLSYYADVNGYKNIHMFSDNGYGGTNFNRPAFQELVTLISFDRVRSLFIKDLSRITRSYLLTESFLDLCSQNSVSIHSFAPFGVDSKLELSKATKGGVSHE